MRDLPEVVEYESIKFVPKIWGHEIWIANSEEHNYCLKELFVKDNGASSWHFHKEKHETFYVLAGRGIVRVGWEDNEEWSKTRQLMRGCRLEIPTGLRHRIIGVRGLTLAEVSTYHRDEDSYRLNPGWF
jgi:mannose-6-phosphate isomerase-like protein (cupin superfamily)